MQIFDCTDTPPDPKNVGAYVVSGRKVLVWWDKPIGNGYKYKVTYKEGHNTFPEKKGIHGYTTVGNFILSSLTPGKEYKITVNLECASNANIFSPIPGVIKAKTFAESTLQRSANTSLYQFIVIGF